MKNLKIKILIGIPASGKTTWVKNFLGKNPNWVSINRDSYRYMLRDEQMCSPKIETMITDMVKNDMFIALSKKLNVIVDATNVKLKYINTIINDFKYSADIDYLIFDISLKKAIERDKNRKMTVGENVIKKMYKDYKDLIDSFNFEPVPKQNKPHTIPDFNSDLEDAVIFDIDGTIALMNYKRGPFDWNKVDRDEINKIVTEQIDFHIYKQRKIILLSGRDSTSRDLTKEWLKFYNIPYDELYMRAKDDYRKDYVVKKELYENYIKNRYNILAVYDDRLQIIDMWSKEGIFTFNVNQGNVLF